MIFCYTHRSIPFSHHQRGFLWQQMGTDVLSETNSQTLRGERENLHESSLSNPFSRSLGNQVEIVRGDIGHLENNAL